MFPPPEVVDVPVSAECISAPTASSAPDVFPVCAVMHAQARNWGEAEDLSESFTVCPP